MKNLLYVIAALTAFCAVSACSLAPMTPMSALDRVEEECAEGHYAKAQALADSLVAGAGFETLDTRDLCRLSLSLMHLGESADASDINTAMAARCLSAAMQRDSDSTAMHIRAMTNEDRARMMLLRRLSEASHTAPADEDSIPYEE